MNHKSASQSVPQSGSLLIEVALGMTLLTVGLLGFCTSFTANFSSANEVEARDSARVAIENVIESLREAEFESLYTNYNNASFEAVGLSGYPSGGISGGPATVKSTFHVNELNLPGEFGPITDLNGDGKLASSNCSADYRILPCILSLTYTVGTRTETATRFIVLRGD